MASSILRATPYGTPPIFSSPTSPAALLSARRLFISLVFLLSFSITPTNAIPQVPFPSPSPTPTQPKASTTMAPTSIYPATSVVPGSTTTTTTSDDSSSSPQPFNYFFLLIAAIALILILGILYFSHRRRLRKIARNIDGQRALARDVESWGRSGRGFTGTRRGWYGSEAGLHRREAGVHRREAGLDERGEAPPSYELAAADKPPSLRHVERQVRGSVDTETETASRVEGERRVELVGLPAYDAADSRRTEVAEAGEDDIGDIQRPAPAIVAGETSRRWIGLGRLAGRDEAAT